jgi:formate transporter FocA
MAAIVPAGSRGEGAGSNADRDRMPVQFDAFLPPQMAVRAEQAGVAKASLDATRTFVLAVLAGAFIAMGAIFATTVSAGAAELPFGVARLLAGLVFCVGLILVVVGGAELFTGNTLIVMAWAGGRLSTVRVLRNWALVFLGNFAGALATAVVTYAAGQHTFGGGAIGMTALGIAHAKVQFGFVQAVALGMLCNALVCLAVWLTLSARTTTDRILGVLFPIACFVAAGFEHSVANMYFIPIALLIRDLAPPDFWIAIGRTADHYVGLTWGSFLARNLLPVTIGNIIGGGLMVAAVYWFVYLRAPVTAAPAAESASREES